MSEAPTKQRPRQLTRRAVPLALALGALTLAAAACGGSPSASVANLGSSTSTSSPTSPTGGKASPQSGGGKPQGNGSSQSSIGIGGITVQFAQCMRTHGVPNFPDPDGQGRVQFSGVDPNSASFQGAQRACAKDEPSGGKPPTAAQTQQALAQALKYSQCMRSHGLADFPDPQTSPGGGIGIRISIKGGQTSDLNPNNPLFQSAQKACQSIMPGGGKLRSGSATAAG
ncbi:MAG: hypothetical protein JWO62_2379 [Acidimicrobiaceae bacterium]|nr:hypothetical protein [Acidimicrobiaceae bacterium]